MITDTSSKHSNKVRIQPCQYRTGKTLGSGSYSVVKECVHINTGRYFAAKIINKRLMTGREHMVRNEIAILKHVSMGHQNVLTLVDFFETPNNLYLITDLAVGGELFDRILRKGNYYEADAVELVRATLSAVSYLHDHGIVHRDLKPENLLFRTPEENADLLIADFGLSRIMNEENFHALTTTCGTPGYMAPEIFTKTGHGKPVDMWAIGVMTYFLLCGYAPFDRDTNLEEMQAILAVDYSFVPIETWRNISLDARLFIKRCLVADSTKRITAYEALSHPFITKIRKGDDLLPVVKKNFNARRTIHTAIDTIRAINKLRRLQDHMMNGSLSEDPIIGALPFSRINSNGSTSTENSKNIKLATSDSISKISVQEDSGTREVQPNDVPGQTTLDLEKNSKITSTGLWSPRAPKK